ncbi:hypothetical protein [Alicyclobacillus dauci]|uniref:Uncharacterized protein n=1 Tax=Alicyclobacillus dauci TaxID=1475485 RepID=A0ABY6YZS8_9BACL|nr:hypothetical protein [Alicyclobacillus dauci]WAH36135.1 hypothetical protein NZD86_18075 [Alicyclobacillus dauci]
MQATKSNQYDNWDTILGEYAVHKLRHANRFERYFPSNGKRHPKYYAPPRNRKEEDVQW